jgi:hypothetical protein
MHAEQIGLEQHGGRMACERVEGVRVVEHVWQWQIDAVPTVWVEGDDDDAAMVGV